MSFILLQGLSKLLSSVSFAVRKAFPFIAFVLTSEFKIFSSCATVYVYFKRGIVSREYPKLIKILLFIIFVKWFIRAMLLIYWYIHIFNCNWVDIRWQWNSIHLHTNNTQNTENGTYITIKKLYITIKKLTNLGSAGRAPFLTSYTLAFALQLRKKHGKPSVRVALRTSQTDTVQHTNNEQYKTQKKNSNTKYYNVTEQ
jgi:hypothetical protein